MKKQPVILMMLVAASVATGCKPSGPAGENPPATSTNAAAEAVQTAKAYANAAVTNTVNATTQAWADVKASFQSAMGYAYDKKAEFLAKSSDDLAVLDQKIKDLSDRAASAGDSAKAGLQMKITELRGKRAELDQKLAQVKAATADDWDSAKAAFQNAYDDVKNTFKDAWHSLTAS